MEQYIKKSAVVAEIDKRIIDAPINNIGHQRVWAYNDVKDIIGTLEVKEVDIWHDAKELPKDSDADIIIEGDVLDHRPFYACCTFKTPFLKWEVVTRWAYIDDLINL